MPAPSSPIAWGAVAQKRIVFGHQSIGNNIIAGVQALAARDQATLPIDLRRGAAAGPGITHFMVGTNGDPLGKIRDFAAVMDSGAAQGADVALVKLCYVDFDERTDAAAVADAYITSLDALAAKYPKTAFVAVTAPLTTRQSGPKAWVKRVLGREPAGVRENAVRGIFNAKVRAHFAAPGRLFDLAQLEAAAGDRAETMNPAWASDGAHLNARGQAVMADAFLRFLATLPARE